MVITGQGGSSGPGDLGDPSDPGEPVVQVVQVVRMNSLDDMQSENIWFSWSKPSNYRGKLRCHACDRRTNKRRRKVENRAMLL